jgi:hypothetical protein
MHILMFLRIMVRNHKEGRALEQDYLVCV